MEFVFTTIAGKLRIETITINQQDFQLPKIPKNIDWKNIKIEITFSDSLGPLEPESLFYPVVG